MEARVKRIGGPSWDLQLCICVTEAVPGPDPGRSQLRVGLGVPTGPAKSFNAGPPSGTPVKGFCRPDWESQSGVHWFCIAELPVSGFCRPDGESELDMD